MQRLSGGCLRAEGRYNGLIDPPAFRPSSPRLRRSGLARAGPVGVRAPLSTRRGEFLATASLRPDPPQRNRRAWRLHTRVRRVRVRVWYDNASSRLLWIAVGLVGLGLAPDGAIDGSPGREPGERERAILAFSSFSS
jgi:hypothetical protein